MGKSPTVSYQPVNLCIPGYPTGGESGRSRMILVYHFFILAKKEEWIPWKLRSPAECRNRAAVVSAVADRPFQEAVPVVPAGTTVGSGIAGTSQSCENTDSIRSRIACSETRTASSRLWSRETGAMYSEPTYAT